MFDFDCGILGEPGWAVNPIHTTHKLGVLGECELASETSFDINWALSYATGQGILRDVQLEAMIAPFKNTFGVTSE